MLRHGMRLNPDAGYLYCMSLGEAYFFLDQTEHALLNLNEAWRATRPIWKRGFFVPAWLETSPLTDSRQKHLVIELLKGYGLS